MGCGLLLGERDQLQRMMHADPGHGNFGNGGFRGA